MAMELFDFHIYENIKKSFFFRKIGDLSLVLAWAMNDCFTAIKF